MRLVILFGCLAFLLVACNKETIPPSVAISSPASGSTVTSTVPVQIASNADAQVSRVDVYVRGKGSQSKGVLVGSAVQEPYVVNWVTTGQPNQASLELVAVGIDPQGREGTAPPLEVKTQNGSVPAFKLLTAYTISPSSASASLETSSLPSHVNVADVQPPSDVLPSANSKFESTKEISPLQANRNYILEWLWEPYSSATGYGVYASSQDIAGPYEQQIKQAGTAAGGLQKYSKIMPNVLAGNTYYGSITSFTDNGAFETGLSNADKATFLSPQEAISPAPNAQIPGGVPTFNWQATPGAVGYLYYVYDRNPWEKGATLLWSNYPNSTSALSVAYPATSGPLKSGSYWWWVAGVSFDNNAKADAFSFSDPRNFVVP